jgi:single-strand DNA-binding protein
MFKGSQIYVEGRLQTRSWDDKNTGEKKYRTEIVAEQVQFGSKPKGDGGGSSSAPRKPVKPQQSEADKQWQDVTDDGGDVNPDDIPF